MFFVGQLKQIYESVWNTAKCMINIFWTSKSISGIQTNIFLFFLKNHSNETCVFWTSPNCFDWSENDHEFIEFRGQIHKIFCRLKTYLGFCSIKFCWITPDISPGQSTFWTALKIVILSFFISRIDSGRELLGDVIRLSVLLLIKEEFQFQKP